MKVILGIDIILSERIQQHLTDPEVMASIAEAINQWNSIPAGLHVTYRLIQFVESPVLANPTQLKVKAAKRTPRKAWNRMPNALRSAKHYIPCSYVERRFG